MNQPSPPLKVEPSHGLTWTVDEHYRIVKVNKRTELEFQELFGFKPELNYSIIEAVSRNDQMLAKKWQKRYDEALEKGHVDLEEIYPEQDGITTVQYQLTSTINRRTRLIKTSVNRIRHDQSQVSLIRHLGVLACFENSQDPMWIIDREFRLVSYNREFFSFHRLFIEDTNSIPTIFLADVDDSHVKAAWECRIATVFDGASCSEILYTNQHGTLIAYRITCKPLKENGSVIGSIFVAQNVSTEVNQESLIKKQNADLKKLRTQLDKLVYSASHDLRGPIATSKGLLNVIKADFTPENIQTCVDHIQRTMDKLEIAVREIAQFALVSRTRVSNEVVSVKKLIESIVQELQFLKGYENVRFVLRVSDNDVIITDRQRLKLILCNLISNSIQFQDPNKEPYVIVYSNLYSPGKISIDVIDNGIGIPADQLDKIFGMFHKASTTNSGVGLGLFIAAEAAAAIGGEIKVYSEYGVGSKFKIDLTFADRKNKKTG